MNLTEASARLNVLARSHNAGLVEHGDNGQMLISTKELEAITFAAAMLGVFVEAMEETE